jgi:anti-anti-sigma factor
MVDIQNGEIVKVAFKGRLDATNSSQVSEQLQTTLEELNKNLLLDMQELEYISSAGLQVVLTCAKAAQKAGKEAQVSKMNAGVREILNISGFLTFLKEV